MNIEFKELGQILTEVRELRKLIEENKRNGDYPEFVTAEKAAEILGTTTQTLYNHSKKGLYPKYKFGDRNVYYKMEEIYAAFKKMNEK
jgi:predicted DNA-binding transcriptional regulator AlpA